MMKGAAENTPPMQATPSQAGTRHALRARMGSDQLMADFEGLLARQSMARDAPLEKADEAASDDQLGQSQRASREALFLALTGGSEFAAQPDQAEQPQDQDGTSAESHAPMPDESAPQAVTAPLELLAAAMLAQAVQPQRQAVPNDDRVMTRDKSAVLPKAAVSLAQPLTVERAANEPGVGLAPDVVDDSHSPRSGDASSAVDRKVQATAGEPAVREESGENQGSPLPVTLIRVAGQETHFAPSPVFLFDDHMTGTLTMNAPAGPNEPSRLQPAIPPPIAAKAQTGPLKMLRVELGSNELGLINATMALKDNMLDLRIGAARDDAVMSLRENAGKLSDTLQSMGFSVDGVTVQKLQQSDTGSQTGTGQPMQHGATTGQDGSGQGQQRTLNGSGFGAEDSAGRSRHSPDEDHLAEHESNDQAKNTGGIRNSRDVFL